MKRNLRDNKLIHYSFTFKAMMLLIWSLFSDLFSLRDSLQNEEAQNLSETLSSCAYVDGGISEWLISCDAADGGALFASCGVPKAQLILFCPTANRHPLFAVILTLIIISCIYILSILFYALYHSPEYGTVQYYAFMIMTKRERYYKIFIRLMFGVIVLLFLFYMTAAFLVYNNEGYTLTSFAGSILSTIFVSGIAVAELKTTNEINFKYVVSSEQKIYLKPQINRFGISTITATDVFEKLEEAVLLYQISTDRNDYLLKELLLNETEDEVNAVITYYQQIFKHGKNATVTVNDAHDDGAEAEKTGFTSTI